MTFTLVTGTRKKAVKIAEIARAVKDGKESKDDYLENFAQVPCIQYLVTFRKKSVPMLAFIDLDSEINAIHPTFARELGLPIKLIGVRAKKIDSTTLDIFGMVLAAFSMTDKTNWVKLFKKTFLVANNSLEVVFKMSFLILSCAEIDFLGRELRWWIYITKKIFPTTKRIKLVGKKEFAAIVLDLEHKTYVIHIGSVIFIASPSSSLLKLNVYPLHRP